jgi:REP element-mobilizing transposase RayT
MTMNIMANSGFFEENNLIKSAFSLPQSKGQESLSLNNKGLLERVYPESYDLTYTCLLIPHNPTHQLKAALADRLSQWLQEICASYKWQLEFITVKPDYFQWGLRVVPSTETGQFMQEIRNTTSKLILSNFEYIRNENSTNDFWAAGYLVVLGTRPHPIEMIEQYIRLLRRLQGFSIT